MAPNHASTFVRVVAKRWKGYVQAGLLSREIKEVGVPTPLARPEGNIAGGVMRESSGDPARSENHGMCGISMCENREIPRLARRSDDRWAVQGTLRR